MYSNYNTIIWSLILSYLNVNHDMIKARLDDHKLYNWRFTYIITPTIKLVLTIQIMKLLYIFKCFCMNVFIVRLL